MAWLLGQGSSTVCRSQVELTSSPQRWGWLGTVVFKDRLAADQCSSSPTHPASMHPQGP